MIEISREFVAYAIIAACVLAGIPALVLFYRKRQREQLRRRGIKRFGN